MVIILLIFPEYACKCISTLTSNGFDAYFVGGCVRDGLLSKKCDDIDITTNAHPKQIISLFEKTVPTGIKHGTVTVIIENHSIEVTTFRTEKGYSDARRPDEVNFVSSLAEDLSRRDFTINALACSEDGKIIDLFGGIKDLNDKIIRTVGPPNERFSEDALRILRAYRFASTLNFELEQDTNMAALILANNIEKISGERVLKELTKTANGLIPSAISGLVNTCVLKKFGISESKFCKQNFDKISTLSIDETYKFILMISLLNHNVNLMKNVLKVSNKIANHVAALDELSTKKAPENKTEIKHILYKYGVENTRLYLYYLHITDNSKSTNLFELLDEILDNNEVFYIKQLAINGSFLKKLGYSGKDIGLTLEKILFFVMEYNDRNNIDDICDFLKN